MFVIKHEGKDLELGRIVGGLAWPGEKPGFAVVIGEDLYPKLGSGLFNGLYHYYLLGEYEGWDLGELLTCCTYFTRYFNIKDFYARTNYKPSMDWIYSWNRNEKEKFYPSYATGSKENGQITWQINNLLHCANKQTLHLSRGPKTEGYLREIQQIDISTATDMQFPSIAALGYAVSSLTEYPPDLIEEQRVPYPKSGVDQITGY
jgi:hypothetical protein